MLSFDGGVLVGVFVCSGGRGGFRYMSGARRLGVWGWILAGTEGGVVVGALGGHRIGSRRGGSGC